MYTLVMMAALTTGADTPNWGFRCGCCGGARHSCHGCSGGYGCGGCGGGCYGGCYGGYGCHGASWGCGGCSGLYGCMGGCYGGYTSSYFPTGTPAPPAAKEPPVEPAPAPKKEKAKEGQASNRARLLIDLPAEAKLYIDDKLMKSTSANRSFSTPALDQGQAYFYDVRAELVRDGKTYSETKRVILRPGDVVHASFTEMAQTRATVTALAK
jgi:uncharacterized protein (TIGR03000 family)